MPDKDLSHGWIRCTGITCVKARFCLVSNADIDAGGDDGTWPRWSVRRREALEIRSLYQPKKERSGVAFETRYTLSYIAAANVSYTIQFLHHCTERIKSSRCQDIWARGYVESNDRVGLPNLLAVTASQDPQCLACLACIPSSSDAAAVFTCRNLSIHFLGLFRIPTSL